MAQFTSAGSGFSAYLNVVPLFPRGRTHLCLGKRLVTLPAEEPGLPENYLRIPPSARHYVESHGKSIVLFAGRRRGAGISGFMFARL